MEPLVLVAIDALRVDGNWSLHAVRAFLGEPNEWRAAWNSLWLALASVVLAGMLGTALAVLTRLASFPRAPAGGGLAGAAGRAAAAGRRGGLSLPVWRERGDCPGRDGAHRRANAAVAIRGCARHPADPHDHHVRVSVPAGARCAGQLRPGPAGGGHFAGSFPGQGTAQHRAAAAATGNRQRSPAGGAVIVGLVLGSLRVRRRLPGAHHPACH